MAKPGRTGGLAPAEDIEFQRRAWKVQRVGWGVVALFVAAAIAGLFGSGPLAGARVQGGGLEIEYERFTRRHASTELVVRALAPAGSSALRLVIDNRYLEGMDAVIRAAVVYLFLLLAFRIAGQRSISQITTFGSCCCSSSARRRRMR